MGDDKGRSPLHHFPEGGLDLLLRFHVDSTGGIVQDQNRRIDHQARGRWRSAVFVLRKGPTPVHPAWFHILGKPLDKSWACAHGPPPGSHPWTPPRFHRRCYPGWWRRTGRIPGRPLRCFAAKNGDYIPEPSDHRSGPPLPSLHKNGRSAG